MKKLTLILALSISAFAQDLPSRVVFAGTGWTARQGMPTTGFAGLAVKMTDSAGGLYSYSSVLATSQTNSFASGLAKPLPHVAFVTPWIIATGGLASGNGSVALTYGGGVLASAALADLFAAAHLPMRPPGIVFAGAQINQINSARGIPFAGVNLTPGFGFAFPWGQ